MSSMTRFGIPAARLKLPNLQAGLEISKMIQAPHTICQISLFTTLPAHAKVEKMRFRPRVGYQKREIQLSFRKKYRTTMLYLP
jgi:hypothetical protein